MSWMQSKSIVELDAPLVGYLSFNWEQITIKNCMLLKLKALIVDDELNGRQALRRMIGRCPEVTLVGMAGSAGEAKMQIISSDPDLVFLDISMPGGSGFDLLDSLPNRRFQVVFVTGYEEFAVRAFRASAIDYLLKPVVQEDLQDAISKASRIIAMDGLATPMSDTFAQLNQSLKTKRISRIALQKTQGVDLVEIKEISYLEADVNYTRFHLANGRKIVACNTLRHFEQILELEGFFRVHRSYLINMEHLQAYQQSPATEAVLKNGTRVEVSRRRAASFHEEVLKWKGAV